ncbi:hypothetical protein HK102_009212, partial [Quaeritorhiza haematococci]
MAILRWEPFREMVSLRYAMNPLLEESFVRPTGLLAHGGPTILPLDVFEDENEFVVKALLPGVRPEDVHMTAHGDTPTTRGEIKTVEEKQDDHYHLRERRYGRFQRVASLSTPIDASKVQAQHEDGVSMLRLLKAEEARPKEIKMGGPGSVGGPR